VRAAEQSAEDVIEREFPTAAVIALEPGDHADRFLPRNGRRADIARHWLATVPPA